MTSILYTSDYSKYMDFYPPDALEKWLTADRRTSSSIISESEISTHNHVFSSGGYRGPTNW